MEKGQSHVMLNRFRLRIKRIVFGKHGDNGVVASTAVIVLLIILGFVFLYPLFYMLSYSFMNLSDLLNGSIQWIPSHFYFGNFTKALKVLNYWKTLGQTIVVAGVPSLIQMMVCSIIGYGFAIYDFRGKRFLLGLVLATFIIPPQITIIPRYILFNRLGMLDSLMTYILPALFGQGINSAIFILIFYQTFKTLPKVLLEAARLDGAGEFKIFTKIGIRSGGSGYLITFLFSVVWYWNETYLASIYFGDKWTTLQLQLQNFVATYATMYSSASSSGGIGNINEGIELAATLLTIIPLLIFYFVTQRWFVQSIDKSGITGE